MAKTTEKATTTKTKNSTTTKNAKATTKAKVEKVVETTGLEMTPEMIAQFQAFMQSHITDTVDKSKPKRKSKATKSTIRKEYQGELVSLKSCIHGIVHYRSSKTGVSYTWAEYDDVIDLDIEELLVMSDAFLKSPWLIISEDNRENLYQDLITAFGLTDIYKNVSVLDEIENDIEDINCEALREIVESLSKAKGGKVLITDIAGKVQTAIDNGELDSASKINELSEILGKQLFMPNN